MALHRENVIRAAEKYVSRGKLEAAIKEYRKVLAENPNDANTLNRVGDLYARIERFDEAVKLFSQIAEQYTRDGFFVKAIAIYKKIIKLDPTSLAVYERLAELYHKQGLLNEARTQYQVLADYYQKHDNAASAITIYQRMAELEPDNPSFHLKLAELFESQRLIDKAMKEYRLLADLLIVGGSVEEAVQVYLKALEVSSSDLELIREAVSGLHDTGHVGEAAKVLARAVELNPEAKALAREVGLDGDPGARAPADAPSFDKPVESESEIFADDTYALSDAFTVPESSFDEIQVALEETSSAADAVAPEAEDEIFTFDLDDDEVPASLVTPPADMLEPEAGPDDGLAGDAGGEAPFALGDSDLAGEGPAPATGEFEIEWEEMELPAVTAAGEEIELEIDLEETVPGRRQPEAEPFELEAFELGEPSLEPVERTAADHDVEIELEPITADLESELFQASMETSEAFDGLGEAEGPPPAFDGRREEDLLAEAKVFFKYGLQEKARDRLSELFQLHPDHLEGLELQARIDLEAGLHGEVLAGANLVSRFAAERGQPELWHELRATLAKAGYRVERERVLGVPGAKAEADDRIAQLLDDLSLDAFDAPVAAPQSGPIPVPGRQSADEPEAAAAGEEEAEAEAAPRDEAPAPASAGEPKARAPRGKKLVSLVDELGLDDLEDQLDDELAAQPAGPAAAAIPVEPSPADPLDETGMSWLDELETEGPAAAGDDEAIFDEEDDFFDLAAELERELTEDEARGEEAGHLQEQSLEDIIEGFKKGVAENLSPEDYDTHFNLGIAYREMGLLDEAIGEFQLAAKDDRYVVDSSSLLGICFLEKGLPELAVRSYRKGLESPLISEDATLGLLYDMGNAYLSLGDSTAAYKTFVEVYGLNSHYRDVGSKLQELQAEG